MKEPDLDDLRLFLAVADAGGLGGAARATGTSAPTLSRRMATLERALNERLFERGPRGYALTAAGRSLAEDVAGLRQVQARLARRMSSPTLPRVRITAGLWTSRFIARHLGTTRPPDATWVPEILASNATVDIARREADIGVRNRRPDQPWMAARRTIPIRYAVFARSPDITGYIALPRGAADTPSGRWLRAHHESEIVTTASDMAFARELAASGLGRVVLPTFAGAECDLVQIGPVIDTLTHDEWLVSHHDGRHDPPVRAALDCLAGLLGDATLRP